MLNLIGSPILVSGILYLDQFRAGLIDAKVQSLLTQGEIIARAIAAPPASTTNEGQLDPEKLLDRSRARLAPTTTLSPTRSNSPSIRARRADPAPAGEADGEPRAHL